VNGTTIDLKEHIAATYFVIQKGFAVLGIALPFVLWIGGISWQIYRFNIQ
jgi:hypothetical protein